MLTVEYKFGWWGLGTAGKGLWLAVGAKNADEDFIEKYGQWESLFFL